MELYRASEGLRILVAVRDAEHRRALGALLTEFDNVEVVGTDKDGTRALGSLSQLDPHLIFLDRGLLTGGELRSVRRLLERGSPLIAFVMSRPQPVDAFEPGAIDYLVLPTTKKRARVTLNRAKERLEFTEPAQAAGPSTDLAARTTATDLSTSGGYLQRIPVRTRDGFKIIPVGEVVSMVANLEYLHLTATNGDRHVILGPLKALEARLDPARFIRLSRSTTINIDFIQRVVPEGGTLIVMLKNGESHSTSRRRARELRTWLLRV